jgi:hypothetical protein
MRSTIALVAALCLALVVPTAALGAQPGVTSLDDGAVAYYLSPDRSQCAIVDLHWVAQRSPGGALSYSQRLSVQLSGPTCQPSNTSNGVDLDASDYRIVGLTNAYVDTSLVVAGHPVSVDVAWTATSTPQIYSDLWANNTVVIYKSVSAHLTGTVTVDGKVWTPNQQTAILRSGTVTSFPATPTPATSPQPSPTAQPSAPAPTPVSAASWTATLSGAGISGTASLSAPTTGWATAAFSLSRLNTGVSVSARIVAGTACDASAATIIRLPVYTTTIGGTWSQRWVFDGAALDRLRTAIRSATSLWFDVNVGRNRACTSLAPPVVSCPFVLADGTHPPTKVVPATLPALLPIDLVPPGAAIYALTFPQSWTYAPDALYTVGPAVGRCQGGGGGDGSVSMQLLDASGRAVVDFVQPGGDTPAQELACAYVAAARQAVLSEAGSLGPSECVPSKGDQVTQIATGVTDTFLAVVASSAEPLFMNSRMSGATISLYQFARESLAIRGSSWRATCASGLHAPTCYAALAFLTLGTPGVVLSGGTPEVDAQIAAALGVPATPAP